MAKKMNDEKLKFCKKCLMKTKHIKRGFGSVGGLCGNARWECKSCGEIHE